MGIAVLHFTVSDSDLSVQGSYEPIVFKQLSDLIQQLLIVALATAEPEKPVTVDVPV